MTHRWKAIAAAVLWTGSAIGCIELFDLEEGELAPPGFFDGGGGVGAGAAGGSTPACSGDEECNDDNACTDDVCEEGICANAPVADDVAPEALQTAGDCRVINCEAGSATEAFDDADVPVDENDCTEDLCDNGVPSNPAVALGAACGSDLEWLCDGDSTCVECNAPADCDHLPEDDECQQRTCVENVCGQDFTAAGTPVEAQDSGDCYEVQCDGSGVKEPVVDDEDVPIDNLECTDDVCTAGAPSNPPVTQGTICGVSSDLVCDGGGACVGCNFPTDCGTNNFCLTHTCEANNECGVIYTDQGTPLDAADQTDQNCQELQCDDMGNTVSVADDNDLPADDGNDCTDDSCDMGAEVHPDKDINTACGTAQFCDGMGTCVECNDAGQCPTAPDCEFAVCDNNNACDTAFVDAGVAAPPGLQTDGDCQIVNCNGDGTTVSGDDNADIPNDANECTDDTCMAGTPDNQPTTAGTMCTAGICNGDPTTPACVECLSSADCDADAYCNLGDNTCDADLGNGKMCGAAGECVSGFCVDGVCCDQACTEVCVACSLSGMEGTCAPDNLGFADPGCGGETCNGTGACFFPDGTACENANDCSSGVCVDDVCCDAMCNAACFTCALTGMEGQCVEEDDGFQDAACAMDEVCFMGACTPILLPDGEPCSVGSECETGNCVDDVCCDVLCDEPCFSCALPTTVGQCASVPDGMDPDGDCAAGEVCEAGACESMLLPDGTDCNAGSDCASNFCIDKVCCDMLCDEPCFSCALLGTEGICTPAPDGTDPRQACAIGEGCCAGGTCAANKCLPGEPCDKDADCADTCGVDGICDGEPSSSGAGAAGGAGAGAAGGAGAGAAGGAGAGAAGAAGGESSVGVGGAPPVVVE